MLHFLCPLSELGSRQEPAPDQPAAAGESSSSPRSSSSPLFASACAASEARGGEGGAAAADSRRGDDDGGARGGGRDDDARVPSSREPMLTLLDSPRVREQLPDETRDFLARLLRHEPRDRATCARLLEVKSEES